MVIAAGDHGFYDEWTIIMFLRRQLSQEWEQTPGTFFENGWNSTGETGKWYSILWLCSAEAEHPEQNIFDSGLAQKDCLVVLIYQ